MIIDPQKAYAWLTNAEEGNIQQSGIDVRLKSLTAITGGRLGKTEKRVDISPVDCLGGWFTLLAGDYDFACYEHVVMPEDCCAILIQRSSLNRLGLYITTGLYDNGFHNYIGGVLHVPHTVEIEEGCRIAQIIFIKSESRSTYRGQYNG